MSQPTIADPVRRHRGRSLPAAVMLTSATVFLLTLRVGPALAGAVRRVIERSFPLDCGIGPGGLPSYDDWANDRSGNLSAPSGADEEARS